MKVKELYDHITKNMTAEQALMRLLEGTVLEYEHLKFSEQGKEIHPIILVSMVALDLGWDIAISDDEEEDIKGIVIGTDEYIDSIFVKDEQGN